MRRCLIFLGVLICSAGAADATDPCYVKINNFTGDIDRYHAYFQMVRRRIPVQDAPPISRAVIASAPTHLFPDPPGFRHFGGSVWQLGPDAQWRQFGFRSVASDSVFHDYLEITAASRGVGTTITEVDGVFTLSTPAPPKPLNDEPWIRKMDQKFSYHHPYVLNGVWDGFKADTKILPDLCRQSETADYLHYVAPSNVPMAVRELYWSQLLATVGVQQQRRDQEPAEAWVLRRAMNSVGADFARMCLFDIEDMIVTQQMMGPETDQTVQVKLTARSGSKLEAFVKSLVPRRQAPFPHASEAMVGITTHVVLPDVVSEFLRAAIGNSAIATTDVGQRFNSALQTGLIRSSFFVNPDEHSQLLAAGVVDLSGETADARQIAQSLDGTVNRNGLAERSWKVEAYGQTIEGRVAGRGRDGMLDFVASMQSTGQGALQLVDAPVGGKPRSYPTGTLLAVTCDLGKIAGLDESSPLRVFVESLERIYHQYEISRMPKRPSLFGGSLLGTGDPANAAFESVLGNIPPGEAMTASLTLRVVGSTLILDASCSSELWCQGYARAALTRKAIMGGAGLDMSR